MSTAAQYTLILDDGGRSESRRYGQHSDCTVRTFATVTRTNYDVVYDTLAKAGRKSCQGFESDEWLKKRRGKVFGGQFNKVSLIKPRAIPRSPKVTFTITTFVLYHSKGRYLLETPSHVFSLIDGVVHDLWRIKEQPLTGAWQWVP